MKRKTSAMALILVLAMVLSMLPAFSVAAGEEAYTEYYQQQWAAPEAAYQSIMPLYMALVSNWSDFIVALDNPSYDTIMLMDNIVAPASSPARLVDRDITITSAGGPFTITQVNARHFIIISGTLTLENIILCGGGTGGGVAFSTANNVQHLYLGDGSVIQHCIAAQGGGVFMVGTNASTTINGGIIHANTSTSTGGGIAATGGSTLTMYSGYIQENNAATAGGGVQVAGSTFNMINGTIRDNDSGTNGGGVSINNSSVMTMHDGLISSNTAGIMATGNGGGVHVMASSTFIMNDGIISCNNAVHGAGVNILNSAPALIVSSFEMNGGQIKNNIAANNGGGVQVESGSTFDMSGSSTIHSNEALNGAGVHVVGRGSHDNPTTFTMSGGEIYNNVAINNGGGVNAVGGSAFILQDDASIRGNEANNGGGVNVHGIGTTFTMDGGIVHENTAVVNGGGINVALNAGFAMNGGDIYSNIAVSNGGGVSILNGTFTIQNGTIQNNSTLFEGGGIWLAGVNTEFTMINGSIIDNRAYGGDGGGLFAQTPGYANPVPAIAYPRILSIGPDAIFSGNWAANGAFRPDSVDEILYRIATTSATLFGHPINNYDINFRAGSSVDSLTVRFIIENPAHGIFEAPGDLYERTEEFDIDFLSSSFPPFFPQQVPVVIQNPGYIFIGWRIDGGNPDSAVLSCDEVSDFQITYDITFVAQFEPILFRVYFDLNGGIGNSTTLTNVTWEQTNLLPSPPTRAGYTFLGWNVITGGSGTNVTNTDAFGDLANNPDTLYIVLQAQWVQNENGGNNNGGNGNGNGNETPRNGGDGRGNWWSAPPRPTAPRNGVAPDTEPSDTVRTHYLYVIGYPDGNFRPDSFITRAEVAAIAARISTGEFGNFTRGAMYPVNFLDITGYEWFADYVGFAQQTGLLRGYPSGNFEPQWNMTRAEFTAMMARFRGLVPFGASTFPDVGDHWATGYINVLTVSVPGAIIGYEDGTFRPDAPITRAEAVKIVNYVLNRGVDAEGLRDVAYRNFPDIIGHWAYFEIVEASNTHTFVATAYGERWLSARWDIWWR